MASSKLRLGRGLGSLIAGGGSSPAPVKKAAKKASPRVAKAPAKKKAAPPRKATTAPAKAPARKVAVPTPKAKAPARKTVPAKPVPLAPEPTPEPVVSPSQAPEATGYREIPVARIEPNPYQPRREINPEGVKELAESIRSEGLLQPIVVRMVEDRYQLIAGERRWRAHQQLGLKSIAARVTQAGDSSSAVISLIENLQREGLNAIEEALGFASLMADFDLTQEEVSERVGRARASVANALRLLQLDREIQGYIAKGMLSVGHAKVLLSLDDAAQRSLLARRVLETGMSVREAERQVRRLKSDASSKSQGRIPHEAEQTVIRDLEKRLSTRLNTKVHLKHNPKRGRIIIEYFGNEDLQRILEKTGLEN